MAFTTVLAGAQMVASNVQQIIDALSGTAGSGQAIVLTKLNDASTWALDVANADTTNSYGLRVRDAADNNLLLVYKNTITVGASAATDTLSLLVNISGIMYIGDSANAKMTAGLTINQGANDDEILAFKSSDIAHGVTDNTETDTFAVFAKSVATTGGLAVYGYTENIVGLNLTAVAVNTDATRSTAGVAPIYLRGNLKSGTGTATIGANKNLVVVTDAGTTRAIIDSDGDLHLDATSNQNVWDEYDDMALLETYRVLTGKPKDYRLAFAKDISEHAKVLDRTNVITLNEDGHHFVSVKGMFGLIIDGMRQMAQQQAALRGEVTEIRRALPEVA